jgi:predicted DNA-binding protein
MERTIRLPDELLSEVEGTALSQGKTVDQWLEEAVRARLEDRKWSDLLEYGRKTGRASGYKEADAPEIVKRRRRINAGRA